MNIRMSQGRLSRLYFCSVAGVGILLSSRRGLYAIHNDSGDVMTGVALCFLGYVFCRLNCELAPMLLGFILGPLIEENLRWAPLI